MSREPRRWPSLAPNHRADLLSRGDQSIRLGHCQLLPRLGHRLADERDKITADTADVAVPGAGERAEDVLQFRVQAVLDALREVEALSCDHQVVDLSRCRLNVHLDVS